MAKVSKITVRQTRSGIGRKQEQKATLKAMGLGKIGREVTMDDTPSSRGMINRVAHLVSITESEDK